MGAQPGHLKSLSPSTSTLMPFPPISRAPSPEPRTTSRSLAMRFKRWTWRGSTGGCTLSHLCSKEMLWARPWRDMWPRTTFNRVNDGKILIEPRQTGPDRPRLNGGGSFGGLPGVEASCEVGDVAEAGAAQDAGGDGAAVSAL